ncbi:MAG: ABC transporter ATP-binding protein [Candidatus Methanomethyliaceae archaeon]
MRERFSNLLGQSGASRDYRKRYDLLALDRVSFSVQAGEALGIIGPNGAGKTTLLKLLSRITRPSSGRIEVRGRVASLIELGAGFHPDLTGRENIYLNGAILGLSRKEIAARFESIVAFAELEPFIDIPIKRYSSGMYARLGFSTAIHVEPDILLVDEVLAVGDQAFQAKCLRYMQAVFHGRGIVIFVSHNLIAIQQLCDRVIWLDHGRIRAIGSPAEVIQDYQNHVLEKRLVNQVQADMVREAGLARILEVRVTNERGERQRVFPLAGPLRVYVHFVADAPLDNLVCAIAIYRWDGLKLGEVSSAHTRSSSNPVSGEKWFVFETPRLPLAPGKYYMNVALSQGYVVLHDHIACAADFTVEHSPPGILAIGPVLFDGHWWMKDVLD